jgi:hypothetical protein
VVIASLSSRRGSRDPSCIVEAGEHPSIRARCYIRCEEARVALTADLEALLRGKTLSPTKDAPAVFVEKLRVALAQSPDAPTEVSELLRVQGLIPVRPQSSPGG